MTLFSIYQNLSMGHFPIATDGNLSCLTGRR